MSWRSALAPSPWPWRAGCTITFSDHGPAIQWMLAAIPVTLIAILLLPEPAGKTLEEMSGA